MVRQAPDTDVWPEHWQVMEVFGAMGTQLHVTHQGGVIGFQYAALPVVMDMLGVPPAARRQVFADFQVMERAAVNVIRGAGRNV